MAAHQSLLSASTGLEGLLFTGRSITPRRIFKITRRRLVMRRRAMRTMTMVTAGAMSTCVCHVEGRGGGRGVRSREVIGPRAGDHAASSTRELRTSYARAGLQLLGGRGSAPPRRAVVGAPRTAIYTQV